MVNVGPYLYEELKRNSAVAALVSTRIYPRMIPQDAALPALAYLQVSNPPGYSHDGAAGGVARMQITCVAETYLAAQTLSQAVVAALSGRRNLSSMRAAVFVSNTFDRSEIGPEFKENSVQVDIEVHYEE